MKIVFLGTPKFASIILNKLIENGYKPVLVITAPVLSEVKALADKHNIPVLQPEKIQDTKYKIQDSKPDLIILSAYGQIIPKDILDIPKFGSINMHPSLLPKYRGASPIQSTILNGDKETGATTYLMDEKMDHGPIFSQKKLKISNPGFKELHDRLSELGADLLIETLPKIINKEIKPVSQDELEATYTKIIKKQDGHIKWNLTASEIERQTRAYENWPGTYAFWDGKALKIIKSSVKLLPVENDYPFGKVVISPENEILVATKQNYLKIEKLQIEGKKPMPPKEFLNGHKDITGAILC